MPAKKRATKKSTTKKKRMKVVRLANGPLNSNGPPDDNNLNDDFEFHPYEVRRNPPPQPEVEAKRLARRKALTLKAFQTAYDNHHRRKAS